jgi:hypothetical protein
MAEEARELAMMDIEVLHPICHDKVEYGRGLHTIRREVAVIFLGLAQECYGFDERGNSITTKIPIARIYEPEGPKAPTRGTVSMFDRTGRRIG